MSQHRIVVLKDINSERYLPIWIGPCEADAITVELQNMPLSRPMTHDLLKSVINELGAEIQHIQVSDMRDDIFYAQLILTMNGRQVVIDARPSDAMALAVRAQVPIYVADHVMDRQSVTPDEDVENEAALGGDESEESLEIFQDFLDTLDLDDLEDNE